MRKIVQAVLLSVLALGFLGARAQTPLAGSYVGKVQGSQAFIALVRSENKLIAYVCDGKEQVQWFRGAVGPNGALEVRTEAGWRLLGALSAEGVKGTVTFADGKTLEYSATPATGEAGLYRYEATVDGARYLGGWIIDQKGEQRGSVIGGGGLVATFLSPTSQKAQHPKLGELLAFLVNPDWVRQNVNP